MNKPKNLINSSWIDGNKLLGKLPKNDKRALEQEMAALMATSRSITTAKARFLKKEFSGIEARYGKASAQKIKTLHMEHFHMARLRNKIGILSLQLKAAQKAHASTVDKFSPALIKTGTTVKDSKHAASLLAR